MTKNKIITTRTTITFKIKLLFRAVGLEIMRSTE